MRRLSVGLLITVAVCFISLRMLSAETIGGVSTISPDLTSFPGGGEIEASKGIANYHNWGLRLYFVDAKSGQQYGEVRDFIATSPESVSKYYYYGSLKKDIYKSTNISKTSLKKGYEKFVSVKSDYYGQQFPTDPNNKESGVEIKDFFTKLFLTEAEYGSNDLITNALQVFLIEQLKVPVSKVEEIKSVDDSANYYIMAEPVRYFKILNGFLALTATESPLVINASNYGTALFNGVTVKHPYWEDGYKITYTNVIPTTTCLKIIESGKMPNDETHPTYQSCKSISWWQGPTLLSYTPKSVVHEENHIIGGFEYFKYTAKKNYTLTDVVGVKNGLGLGFINVTEFLLETNKECKTMTAAEIAANLPKCCLDPRAVAAPEYKKACPTPDIPDPDIPDNSPSCEYYISTKYPTDCNSSTEGVISDIYDWKCIFDSQTKGGTDYKDHYLEFKNRYCSIFCREDIEYKFPNNSFTVLAGNHFTVGSANYGSSPKWNPVYISGNATCRTNGIDHNLFVSDWNVANGLVNQAWDEWQKEIARQKSIDGQTYVANSGSCPYINNVGGFDHCSLVGYKNSLPDPVTGKVTVIPYCMTNNYERYGRYTPASSFYAGNSYKQASYCSNEVSPKFNVDAKKSVYNSAVHTRDNYLSSLNQCVDYKFDYSSLVPKLQLEYEEERYGSKFDLQPDFEVNHQTKLINGGVGKIDIYVCSKEGSKCSLLEKSLDYPKSDNILHQATKVINYSLKNDVYRYVEKHSGISSHLVPSGNYTDLGYGNLPIDFNRETGKYDIKITYGNLGFDNKFNDFILKGLSKTKICPGNYNCTYNVKNEVLCDKNELKCDLINLSVVFRPISLFNPFPGVSGDKRNPGTNWIGYENLITYNRGVLADEVYTKRKPMYEITLDSNTIRKIRKYNSENSYTDFNLECKDGTSTECISSFLTDLKKGSTALNSLKIASCARSGNNWNDTCKVGG